MARSEYFRFLKTLQNQGADDSVRKLANLVAIHLDELSPLGTYQGQRVKKLVELAQGNWDTVNANTQIVSTAQDDDGVEFSRLKRLTVGPFRGFAKQEELDLNSRIVLIYGPNGTGKSSFCEALEYGLLGNVSEAENKRFRNQDDYFKNAHVNQFAPPSICGINDQGNEIVISANEAAYRFCFVEKNRIDSFSRIAAQVPAKQTELISTLFGLESFTEFVRNFTAEIDGKYIDLEGKKATSLLKKQESLAGAHQQIQNSNDELQKITGEELALAKQYKENIGFNQMVLELNGCNESPGLILQLEKELQRPIATKSGLTSAALEELKSNITTTLEKLNEKRGELAALSLQVSFKQLYEAVSQVQHSSQDKCPACETPLTNTVVNPYTRASQELEKLHQLANTQTETAQLEKAVKSNLFQLSQVMNECLNYYSENNALKPYQISNNAQPEIQWWESLFAQLTDGFTPWQHLVTQVQALENQDKEIAQMAEQRSEKQTELDRLRGYSKQITVLKTRRDTANSTLTNAQKLIGDFQTENEQLIAEVEAEKALVSKNKDIVSAYASFVSKLNEYSNGLPAKLVANLGETVVTLYNAFNRNDSDSEKLAKVILPLSQNQRLRISFRNEPNKNHDALHVLSEGHIRCLGLAILLAKNLKENSPVLIFDDPVNAIDDDHRESIRRTLFEDDYFASKQIILTCHGEEFFKDIQNLLPAQEAKLAKSVAFLPRLQEPHIRIDFNCAPRNYILAARNHIDKNEVRDALAKSRQALEALTKNKVWKYVSKYGDGSLSIKLRSSSSPIELRNLTEQLRSKISKQDFADTNKEVVLEPLKSLLGLNGNSREWLYLNKGTHEESDRAEFDRGTVETIICSLESMDSALR